MTFDFADGLITIYFNLIKYLIKYSIIWD